MGFNETAFMGAFVYQRSTVFFPPQGLFRLHAQPWDLRPNREMGACKSTGTFGMTTMKVCFLLLYALQNEKGGRENAKTWERGGITGRGPGKPMGSSAARGEHPRRPEPHNVGSREQGVRRVPHTRPGRGKEVLRGQGWCVRWRARNPRGAKASELGTLPLWGFVETLWANLVHPWMLLPGLDLKPFHWIAAGGLMAVVGASCSGSGFLVCSFFPPSVPR